MSRIAVSALATVLAVGSGALGAEYGGGSGTAEDMANNESKHKLRGHRRIG